MIVKLISKLFGLLIGRLPEDKKAELMKRGRELLMDVIKSGVEGGVKGMKG